MVMVCFGCVSGTSFPVCVEEFGRLSFRANSNLRVDLDLGVHDITLVIYRSQRDDVYFSLFLC